MQDYYRYQIFIVQLQESHLTTSALIDNSFANNLTSLNVKLLATMITFIIHSQCAFLQCQFLGKFFMPKSFIIDFLCVLLYQSIWTVTKRGNPTWFMYSYICMYMSHYHYVSHNIKFLKIFKIGKY